VSDYSEAFAEVKRVVQPDTDPKLTYGRGETPDPEADLDSVILASVRATVWEAGLVVKYGKHVVPTTGNGRKYRVKVAGALGSSEPSWPDYDYGVVTSGDVTLEEDGLFEGGVYDVRRAIHAALLLKLSKASEYTGAEEERIVAHLEKMAARYAPVGIA
jgi:hypothetical protein